MSTNATTAVRLRSHRTERERTTARGAEEKKTKVLFIGCFADEGSGVFGGNITDCRALLGSSFPEGLELVLLDTTYKSLPPTPVVERAYYSLQRLVQFVRLLHRERPDVMLVFAAGGTGFLEKGLCTWYARRRGVPAVVSVRSGHFIDQCRRHGWFRRVAARVLEAPVFLLCQGPSWQAFYEETFGIPPERCPVVDSWVATREYLELGDARQYEPKDRVELLFLGLVDRFKGIFELLEAVRMLSADPALPPFRLTVAGTGGALEEARQLVAEAGLADRVCFEGLVEGARKRSLLERADVFVLPSHTEGLPNAMIEAMATGLPVVVTPVGSIPDVVVHGEEGLLAEPRDADTLAAALHALVSDAALRRRMGRAAQRKAAERFDVEKAATRLRRLLGEARQVFADEGGTRHHPVRPS